MVVNREGVSNNRDLGQGVAEVNHLGGALNALFVFNSEVHGGFWGVRA